MTTDKRRSKTKKSKSKSITEVNSNTYYIQSRNRIIYDCAYRLAKSSTFVSLLKLNKDIKGDNISSGQNELAQIIFDRIVQKISSEHFPFLPNHIMQEEVTSHIDIIAERIDMQCFHLNSNDIKISKFDYSNETGISIGEYMKCLMNKLLLEDKYKKHEQIKRDERNEKNILYLQTILLLSRAPVQSLRQRFNNIDKSEILSSQLSVKDFTPNKKREERLYNDSNNDEYNDDIDSYNLTEWKKYFAEEEILDCDEQWIQIKNELEDESYDVEEFDMSNIATNTKHKSSVSYNRPTQIDQNTESQSKKDKKSEIPFDSQNKFENLLPAHCSDKIYGLEAIDEIQNYILLRKSKESNFTFHDVPFNHDEEDEEERKKRNAKIPLYTSYANTLWKYLYNSKSIYKMKEIISSQKQLPSAVAIISEVELCQALISTLRGLPNSYFTLVTPTSQLRSNNFKEKKYDSVNHSQTSHLLNTNDYYWILQGRLTDVWPITTSLSHEAVFSILTHALRELADPITIIRQFCDVDSYLEKTTSQHSYVMTSHVLAAFRNCLYECILRPFELQVTNYESNLYSAISSSLTESSVQYQIGTILGLTHIFTMQWSKSLTLAKNLINGAFPFWRLWTSTNKNAQDDNAKYSTTCLNYLYAMVQEDNLLYSNNVDFDLENDSKENVVGPLSSLTSTLFSASLLAYCKLLEKWILEGSLHDPIGELFITRKPFIEKKDEMVEKSTENSKMEMHYKEETWINLHQISHSQNQSNESVIYMLRKGNKVIPKLLENMAHDLFWCGIHIYIIRHGDQSIKGIQCEEHGDQSRFDTKQKRMMIENKYNQLLADGLTTCVISKTNDLRIKIIEIDKSSFAKKFSFIMQDDIQLSYENGKSCSSPCSKISNHHNPNEFEEETKYESEKKNSHNFFTFDMERNQIYDNYKKIDVDRIQCNNSIKSIRNADFDKLNQLGFSSPRIECLLLDNFRLQCSAAGNELYHMFWNTGRFRKDLCSNLSLYEHIIAIHKVYCISDPQIISSFSTELFTSLDEIGYLHLRFKIKEEDHTLRFDQLISSIRLCSSRMTSLLRSSIENQYHDIVHTCKKKKKLYQNLAYNMLCRASIEVTNFDFESQYTMNMDNKSIGYIDTLDILQNLRLTLTPAWPMKIILHKGHLEKYGMIFVLLIQIKYCLHVCDQFWIENKYMHLLSERANKRNVSSISDERRKFVLFYKIMHIVRCFHEHCMSITTVFPSTFGRTDGCSTEFSNGNKGLKSIMTTQNQLIERMMRHCLLVPQDKVLLSYMKKLLSDGVKILFILKDMTMNDDKEIYEAYKNALDEMEDRWNQNIKSFLLMLDQMHVSMDNGKIYEELLIRLRFNNYL